MQITDAHPGSKIALPLMQHPTFAEALRLSGRFAQSVTLRSSGQRIGYSLLTDKPTPMGRIRTVTCGPIFEPTASLNAKIESYQALGREGVRIIGAIAGEDVPLFQAGYRRILTPSSIAQLDLSGKPTDRLARMTSRWRNRLRHAMALSINTNQVRFEGEADHWLFEAERKQQKMHHYRGLATTTLMTWAKMNSAESRLFVAYDGRERIAALLLFVHWPVATIPLGWTSPIGRECSAHQLLVHEICEYLADRNVTRLDLGQVDTDRARGLAQFKLGTGAQMIELGGIWLRVGRGHQG